MSRLLLMITFCCLGYGQVRFLEMDGRSIGYTVQDGFAITEGDIILGPADAVESYRTTRGARPRSISAPGVGNARLWTDATMYYTMESDVPVPNNLKAAIDYWNN